MADPTPSRPGTGGRLDEARYYGDEVSLRQIYLVLLAGLPLIVVVALVAGAAAFAVQSLRPVRHTATATVNVIPPLVGTDSLSGLELSVSAGMDPDSYRAIAFSPDLLGEVGGGFGYTAAQVNSMASLTARQAPSQARGHLVVDHTATLSGAAASDDADDLANAWAEATVAAVAQTLSSHLEGAVVTVTAEIAERRNAFQQASDAWAEFLAHDDRGALEAQLARLASDPASSPSSATELRARLAELEAAAATLERELSTASLVYYRVAPTGPALELQRDLVAGSAFIAIPASAPVVPGEPGKLVIALAAGLVGALAATLLVFLRAAVRER